MGESKGVRRLPVKKLPPALRKPKPSYLHEPRWYRRVLLRLREDSQFLRTVAQFTFAALCLWIGVEFSLFVRWGASNGAAPFVERPPGVEGFLPISALISLKYWLQTGVVNRIHPSGLFILLGIVGMSLLVKKSFCSWLCPIGTLSESLWMLGRKLFRRNVPVPPWLDYPLRSLKYLLMGFFVVSILRMDPEALAAFIYSPYNKMADVKMYQFFSELAGVALWTILGLIVLSVFIKNFWCRYLCPYGGLLGLMSWLSPLKITRTSSSCIDCALCTRACPMNIKVHTARRVWSDECTNCLACVQACPVKETLEVRLRPKTSRIPVWVVGSLAVGLFVAVTGAAMLAGTWQNAITRQEYLHRFQQVHSPLYQHFRGQVPHYGPND
ncbi:MAG TPA: 4Fe-4S binding protein [Bacteroidota bacterium]